MKGECWDVGVIPCTLQKYATGMTARTLYRGGIFSIMLRHAAQRCAAVVIMSAKHGLVLPDDPIRYYDTSLPNLDAEQREDLKARIAIASPFHFTADARILSYLPSVYHGLLTEAVPYINPRRPYSNLPRLRLLQVLSNEVKHYGTHPSRR